MKAAFTKDLMGRRVIIIAIIKLKSASEKSGGKKK